MKCIDIKIFFLAIVILALLILCMAWFIAQIDYWTAWKQLDEIHHVELMDNLFIANSPRWNVSFPRDGKKFSIFSQSALIKFQKFEPKHEEGKPIFPPTVMLMEDSSFNPKKESLSDVVNTIVASTGEYVKLIEGPGQISAQTKEVKTRFQTSVSVKNIKMTMMVEIFFYLNDNNLFYLVYMACPDNFLRYEQEAKSIITSLRFGSREDRDKYARGELKYPE